MTACSTWPSTTCAAGRTDRHRTVDDTPYGGGPGMLMRPEPWGDALDAVLDRRAVGRSWCRPRAAPPSRRRSRTSWRRSEHLVFACGRYEGIDQRVLDEAAGRARVLEVSLGDYVLNGGEVAVLAIVEAVARLLPGVIGNADSLVDESHSVVSGGLLEAPGYTKPASWRGRDVPEVLLSGDHARIARWRRDQALATYVRTPPRPAGRARPGHARRRRPGRPGRAGLGRRARRSIGPRLGACGRLTLRKDQRSAPRRAPATGRVLHHDRTAHNCTPHHRG